MKTNLRRLLINLSKTANVEVEISQDHNNEERGSIELTAPDGFQFDADLHSLVNEQGDAEEGGLEPFDEVILAAIEDIKNYPIKKCPDDCVCREEEQGK